MFECQGKDGFGCLDHLKAPVPAGTSVDLAETAIKECRLEYSLDRSGKITARNKARREERINAGESRGSYQI
jgi:hypothetical protein